MTLSKTVNWLSETDLHKIYTADYWNDSEEEKKKNAFWINDDGNALMQYLNKSGLLSEYKTLESLIKKFNPEKGIYVDMACGIGWVSVMLSKLDQVTEVHAIDISKHRINNLFENCAKIFDAETKKIYRYLGSFYNTQFNDNSVDVVVMQQAFHHADNPIQLFTEINRILKPGGWVYIVGEHNISFSFYCRRIIKNLIKKHKLALNFFEAFPPDDVLGDHYYLSTHYQFIFNSFSYSFNNIPCPSGDYIIYGRKPHV